MIKQFLKDENGQALTEYALATVFVTLAALGFYKAVSSAFCSVLEKIIERINISNLIE